MLKNICPLCKISAKEVPIRTLKHFLKQEVQKKLKTLDSYFFCKSVSCEIIYFKDDKIIKQEDLLEEVALKTFNTSSTICYCFSWSKKKMQDEYLEFGKITALEDINKRMQKDSCSCIINNPSGHCCLNDIKNTIKEISGLK